MPQMAYSEADELLIGDITLGSGVAQSFVDLASMDMDAEMGFVYVIPLSPTDGGSIPDHVTALLAKVNRLLASGRFILSRNASQEDSLHAYGNSLLSEGRELLTNIVNGTTLLTNCDKTGPQATGDDGGNAPSITVGDTTSGIDAFYGWLDTPLGAAPPTPGDPWWKPGT